MKRAKLIAPLAAGLLAVACAETVEYRYLGTEPIRNEKGHVVGHKELLRDERTGEQVEQLTQYLPMHNDRGEITGYQEPTRAGMVIRNLEGRRIGARYTDLRSRGTNPNAEGVGITIRR
jgi:hypothetical protein